MLFRRRKKQSFWQRARSFVWPQKSFVRSIRYLAKRVLRLKATPHAIAVGVAAGVFASWTPLIGFHFLLAFFLAYLFAGNMIAAGLGTAFGNPISFPFIWAASLELGRRMLGAGGGEKASIDLIHMVEHLEVSQLWGPVLKPMLIGCLPPGILSALIFYIVTYLAVRGFQERRQRLMADRANSRGRDNRVGNMS